MKILTLDKVYDLDAFSPIEIREVSAGISALTVANLFQNIR